MTKIKNTKKGMAKKTLSISLAVAMLATSNVPVWAAEDLFTDGSDVAVEAFEADTFSDEVTPVEEAPVVEEEVTVDAQAINDDAEDINLNDYKVNNFKIGAVGDWNSVVTAGGTVTGIPTGTKLQYTWYADGVEASNQNGENKTKGEVTASANGVELNDIKYKPTYSDFNKTLSLRIYVLGDNETPRFSQTVVGGTVKPQDISYWLNGETNPVAPILTGVTEGTIAYNGKEQKPSVNEEEYWVDVNCGVDPWTGTEIRKRIDHNTMEWHYNVTGNDFTNVTGESVTVYGEVVGTYDPLSPAYGFVGTTLNSNYEIVKAEIQTVELSMVKKSVPYIGTVHSFGKDDVKLTAVLENGARIDITSALVDNAVFTGDTAVVGKNHKIMTTPGWGPKFDQTSAVMNNVKLKSAAPWTSYVAADSYEVTLLDLAKCTATATRDFTIDEFTEHVISIDSLRNFITLSVDGYNVPLTQLAGDVDLSINQSVKDAAKLGEDVLVADAFTVKFKESSKNVVNEKNVGAQLVKELFGEIYIHYGDNQFVAMSTSKLNIAEATKVPYIKNAYSLTGTSGTLYNLQVNDAKNGSTVIKKENYTVSYKNLTTGEENDTTNAGIIEVTIKGKDTSSYKNHKKVVYFQILKDKVNESLTVKETVTINPANNYNASLYKDALKAELKTTLANGAEATLEEGKDYTVEYFFANSANLNTKAAVKAAAGTNNVGQYVYAVATITDGSNFEKATNTTEFVAGAEITKKSIANVDVTVEKDSYVFTGKEIAANVTVKDGSVVLEKGVDYTLKFKDNKHVGKATVEVIPTADSDYAVDTMATATFEITPAKAEDVKVILAANGKTEAVAGKENTFYYNGRQLKPVVESITLNGVTVTEYFDTTYPTYGENVNAGKEAGSIVLAPKTTTKDFTGTKTQLFNIKGEELVGVIRAYYGDKTQVAQDVNGVALGKDNKPYSFYYDGLAQTFAEARFTPNASYKVTEGIDYEVKYVNNVNAGYGFVVAVAKGNYEGLCDWTFNNQVPSYKVVDGELLYGTTVLEKNVIDIMAFKINPSYFTARNITVKNGTYAGGKPVKPEVSVVVNGRTLVEDKDYYLELTDIDHASTPDTFVDVTSDKPYYVVVNAMGGYRFDAVNGSNAWTWGIDKKDIDDCAVTVTKNGDTLDLKVMNGNVIETKETFDVVDNGDGTATVSVVDGGKNYTGSTTVTIVDPEDKGAVGTAKIVNVKKVGNKATVILDGTVENAEGYDFVIATEEDYKNGRVDITKNQIKTSGDFFYVQNGTYYAYCHAYRHDENGKKVFGEWSNIFEFTMAPTTPNTPVITNVVRKGSTVTVTYKKAENAIGYDIVLGTAARKVNGELRPVNYDTLVKKNQTSTTVTFKNVPAGTYYVGMHAYNRTNADNTKVFSPWANWSKKVTVK